MEPGVNRERKGCRLDPRRRGLEALGCGTGFAMEPAGMGAGAVQQGSIVRR